MANTDEITLFSLPSQTLGFIVLPFLSSSDLLVCRLASKQFYVLLHESDESEGIWERELIRDFSFIDRDTDCESPTHHKRTLRIKKKPTISPYGCNRKAVSVFGCTATDGVFTASSSFESWKHWRKASLRYYDVPIDIPQAKINPHAVPICPISKDKPKKRKKIKCIHGPYFLRAANFWSKIEKWCDNVGGAGRKIRSSLADGLYHFDWVHCQSHSPRNSLIHLLELNKINGLIATRAIYAFYGGQNPIYTTTSSSDYSLLGGYRIDPGIEIHTDLLSINEIANIDSRRHDTIPIASCRGSNRVFDRTFCVHITTGNVVLSCRNRAIMRLAANAPQFSEFEGFQTLNIAYDAILCWLEEYANRLQCGIYTIDNVLSESESTLSRRKESISLLPSANYPIRAGKDCVPIVSTCVMHGVQVVASSIYAPDFDVNIYSIRVRLADNNSLACRIVSSEWEVIKNSEDDNKDVIKRQINDRIVLNNHGGYTRSNSERGAFKIQKGPFRFNDVINPAVNGLLRGELVCIRDDGVSDNTPFIVKVPPFLLNRRPNFIF